MAKKKKGRSAVPKRVLGLRMPKGVRRFASTPLGTAILADIIIAGAAAVARRPAFSGVLGQMGDEARLAGQSGAGLVAHLARAAAVPFRAAAMGVTGKSSGERQISSFDAGDRHDLAAPSDDASDVPSDERQSKAIHDRQPMM